MTCPRDRFRHVICSSTPSLSARSRVYADLYGWIFAVPARIPVSPAVGTCAISLALIGVLAAIGEVAPLNDTSIGSARRSHHPLTM